MATVQNERLGSLLFEPPSVPAAVLELETDTSSMLSKTDIIMSTY